MEKRRGYAYLAGALLLASPVLAQTSGNFMTNQASDQWRLSKLVGADVYSSDNQKVGAVDDVLLNSNGTAQAIVIAAGGVLGEGAKDVAVPFDKVNWSMQGRSTADQGAGSSGTQTNSAAAQGYPNRAMLQMPKSTFDSAPTFTYAGQHK